MKLYVYQCKTEPELTAIYTQVMNLDTLTNWRLVGTFEVEEPGKTEREQITEKLEQGRIAEYKGWEIFLERIDRDLAKPRGVFTIVARFYREYAGWDYGQLLAPRPEPISIENHDENLLRGVVWLCDRIDEAGKLERVIIAPKPKEVVTKSYPVSPYKDGSGQPCAMVYFPPNAKNPRVVWEEM